MVGVSDRGTFQAKGVGVKFRKITEPYVYGYEATVGNRKAEVVRAYAGEWHAFYFIDGKQVSLGREKPATSKSQATKDAIIFLKTGVANPGYGKAFTFHGSFTSKLAAKRKEAQTPGSFIQEKSGRYYVLKPKRIRTRTVNKGRVAKRKANPKGILIYQAITRVEGTKGKDSHYPGQKFYHNFKKPYPVMVGLPDGSLLIRSKK